jgi:2-keto-3-deoxy-L-arabinonate dehydratase
LTTLSGLVPILATPFHADGSLDRASLARLTEFQLQSGADGIATFGMASETFTLDTEERAFVLETVVSTVRSHTPKLPVVAGVASTGLAPALEQARRAVEGGASQLMVLPPYLVPASGEQLIEFYGLLAAEVGVPVMVQDAPVATGVSMPVPVVTTMADIAGVDYIKIEAQPTAPKVDKVVQAVGGKLKVFGGQNAQFLLEELERGAAGTMPASEFTDLLAAVIAARRAGETAAAVEQFTRLLPLLLYGLQPGIAWAVHKEILVRRGIITDGRVRAPAMPLDKGSRDGLLRALEAYDKGDEWLIGGL